MIDGVCITGPGLHFLYGLLESHIPTTAGGALPAAAHVLLDTFLFDPVFVCSFFFTTALFEGRSLRRDVAPRLAREYWPALRGSWGVSVLFWPVQWAAFRYLPLQLRVASINLCDVAWTAALSYASHRGSGGGGSAAFELQAAAEARAGGAGEGGSARPRSDGDCGWSPAEGQKQGQISFSAAS
ncbi:hypothetical protein JKP88DRAFT_234272 [Tribonema minus]|uniref:Uncharacterized protein n=1 Tax=Tribonema minus TaxID=303371 RepID=A0A836CK90_9STRA|nr:hypothetical protein JKP88DRAFT_234272 [Tribonema minus]